MNKISSVYYLVMFFKALWSAICRMELNRKIFFLLQTPYKVPIDGKHSHSRSQEQESLPTVYSLLKV